MDTRASMMLTHSWLKFADMALFTMCVVTCIQTSDAEDCNSEGQDPVPRVDVSLLRVGRCCVLSNT